MPRPLSLSSTCACSSPCLLRVPMRCVLELCTLVLGVWCTCAAFAQIVRHPLVNVVDIAGVHRPVLCAGAVHACVVVLVSPMLALRVPAVHALAVHACGMRACASHARVACTCCACPCCACLCCALSCGVWCACAALIYIVWSSPTLHPRRPWRLAMTFTLSPFSVTYACSCHALFLPLCPISCLCCSFFLFHILLHTLSCSCLRLCLRKVAQVSLSAVELPGHLFVPALPSSCLAFFFATKKKTRRPCFACPLSYSALHHSVCNTFCKSINIVPGVDLITSVGPNLFSCQ